MNTTIDNTLLALLLALKNLENPLNTQEQEALADVGQQLKLDSNDWDFIEDDLMATIHGNDALNQLYQKAKAKLDACDRPIPTDLLPTDAELENALPRESKGGTRAHFEGKPDEQSNEILNLATNVVSTEKPEETAKKLSFLERLSQFLNQPSKND
ncbi:MAG: hypothetical protein F6K23_32640 [Okeania sp. SIO2C9]|uniref:hypothetical protein n=1 Tax=Okeania sp. SIO2C9 TaxID=2607791 RepID=UPI0013C1A569|nr:hypothetical protein [Okeania sp. SIO2C9]NEQ77342.1 hypothetical protein [Okeania sp. SIO2C9]